MNIEKLKSPPIIGELYSVPCMFGQIDLLTKGQIKSSQWWPVIRPSHQDSIYITKFRSIFNGKELVDEEYFENDPKFPHHYHIDPRFTPDSFYTEWEINAASTNPESLHNVISIQGELKWEVMTCLREMPTQRLFTGFGLKFLNDHLGKKIKCNRCPHRGALLNSIPTINGVITCPNHGLKFDTKTKICINNQ